MRFSTRSLLLSVALLLLGASASDDAHAAGPRGVTDYTLEVTSTAGSVTFVTAGLGPIVARAIAAKPGTALELSLIGPRGAAVITKRGSGTVEASYDMTAADLAAGGLWTMRTVATDLPATATATVKLHAEYPGSALPDAQFKQLPEVQRAIARNPPAADPPPVALVKPSVKSNVDIAKGVVANLKYNQAALTSAPLRNIPLPAGAPPAPSTSNSGSGYTNSGNTTTPTAPAYYPPISSVIVIDSNGSRTCNGWRNCGMQRGNTIQIIGQNLDKAPPKVSFYYFTSQREIDVDPIYVSPTSVTVMVPDVTGLPEQDGALAIGVSGGPTSTPFGFHYFQSLTTDLIDFGSGNWPGITVFQPHMATTIVGLTSSTIGGTGSVPGAKTTWNVEREPYTTSVSGYDTLLGGAHLKNGWKVKTVTFTRANSGTSGASLQTSHEGTDDPSVQVAYAIDTLHSVSYHVTITVEGEVGTSYH